MPRNKRHQDSTAQPRVRSQTPRYARRSEPRCQGKGEERSAAVREQRGIVHRGTVTMYLLYASCNRRRLMRRGRVVGSVPDVQVLIAVDLVELKWDVPTAVAIASSARGWRRLHLSHNLFRNYGGRLFFFFSPSFLVWGGEATLLPSPVAFIARKSH